VVGGFVEVPPTTFATPPRQPTSTGAPPWFTRADLEAEIEQLNAEYDSLTDAQGRPLPVIDQAVGDGGRSATVVYAELMAKQREYFESRTVVLMQQLTEDDWAVFLAQWKDALAKDPPFPPDFYAELITRSAIKPRITLDQFAQLRKRVGRPVFDELWRTAWAVNTQAGVSIPKSWFSSPGPRPQQPG
jgi:hypothetical protein